MRTLREILNHQMVNQQFINDNTLYVEIQEDDTIKIMAYTALDSNDYNSIYLKGTRILRFPVVEKENYDIELNQNGIAVFRILKENNEVSDKKIIKLYNAITNELLEDSNLEYHYEKLFLDAAAKQKKYK